MKKYNWTHFWDMHSGGGQKLKYAHIFIEASESEAKRIFQDKFHRDPDNITCDCCGSDYSISEYETLEAATSYHRRDKISLEDFEKLEDICIIRAERAEGSRSSDSISYDRGI